MCNRDIVKDKLVDLISRSFNMSKADICLHNTSLLSAESGLNAITLTYLYFIIQDEFGVVFSKHILNQRRFDNIDGITDIILSELDNDKNGLHPQLTD